MEKNATLISHEKKWHKLLKYKFKAMDQSDHVTKLYIYSFT